MRKVAGLIRLGTGIPAVRSDEVGIEMLPSEEVLPEEARDSCFPGCVELKKAGQCVSPTVDSLLRPVTVDVGAGFRMIPLDLQLEV